jgi:SPP1 family predicted phage head-tail adaptor
MIIGNLDRELTVLRYDETGRTNLNEPIMDWVPIAKTWAEVIFKSADEQYAATKRYAERVMTFRTWYIDGLQETDILECDGVKYDIKGIRELGFREGTEIAAQYVS